VATTRTPPRTRQYPLRHRFGIRARLTIAYALGAALLSAVMSVITFGLTRENLLKQQEEAIVSQAFRNVNTISEQLDVNLEPKAIEDLVGSLPTPEGAQPVLFHGGQWTALNALKFSQSDIPEPLKASVADQQPGKMRVEVKGEPMLVVGVPMQAQGAAYYEGAPLTELDRTLEGLAISLVGASVLTTLAGGLIGFWAARKVFAPILEIGDAAEAIAGGRLDTRLPVGNDPDLDQIAKPFNEMAGALEERIERDARFASEVSHELRSPLMTLAASLEVLENARDELPERAQRALDLLSADLDRFQQLVEDLLEISRFDVGAVKLHLEEVLVAEMVIQAVSVLGGASVPVRYDEAVSDVVVRVDKRRFGRVLANLLDNAGRYAGGATAVTIDRVGSSVRIGVEDHGPGVAEEERELIFDRFSRGSEGGNRSSDSGVGLGLALVAEHVRLHGGRTWVEDRPDGEPGARFVVELPVVEAAVPTPAASTAVTEQVGAHP
jgi:signal transduction histidine kinase